MAIKTKTTLMPKTVVDETQTVPHGLLDKTFNCPTCIGEGLVDAEICSNCQGIGKV